jgi:hypothetical protein
MMRLWSTIYRFFVSPVRARVALDFIELNAFALAVRANARQLRHGHITLPGTKHALVRRRLLDLLEKYRRRAKRAAEKDLGLKAVAQLQERWHGFARWLSFFATSCRCGKVLVPGFCHRWRRFIIDTAVDVAGKELATIGVEPPTPGELRRLVRLALSEVRRGRTRWGVRTLLTSLDGASYLRHFVLERTQT